VNRRQFYLDQKMIAERTNMKPRERARILVGLLATVGVAAIALALTIWLAGWPVTIYAAAPHSGSVVVDNAPLSRDARLTGSFASVVERVSPSVVYVYSTRTVRHTFGLELHPFFDDPLFRRFFGAPFGGSPLQRPRTEKQQNLGSGVIVTRDGYILTNSHVVDGADEVKVGLLNDKTDYPASIVGRDPKTDIAVLKIKEKNLSPVTFADSDTIKVGDVVLAIGNPFGIGQTVTMGIVSATRRGGMGIEDYEDFIQTDAAINPGNSGGALVDAAGRLVGINTAILSRSGGNQGVGFAVPVNLARNVMDQIIAKGRVERGFLGLSIQELTPALAKALNVLQEEGALIGGVTEGGAAATAGLQSGDVITEFDGKPVATSRSLKLLVGQATPGAKVSVKALRAGSEKTFTVTLKQMPDNLAASGPANSPAPDPSALQGVTVGDIDPAARRQFDLPSGLEGALVMNVAPDSRAAAAGLRQGDVIQEINRQTVRHAGDAIAATSGLRGKPILLRVWSQGGSHYVVVNENIG
jgi:serine protease Do